MKRRDLLKQVHHTEAYVNSCKAEIFSTKNSLSQKTQDRIDLSVVENSKPIFLFRCARRGNSWKTSHSLCDVKVPAKEHADCRALFKNSSFSRQVAKPPRNQQWTSPSHIQSFFASWRLCASYSFLQVLYCTNCTTFINWKYTSLRRPLKTFE